MSVKPVSCLYKYNLLRGTFMPIFYFMKISEALSHKFYKVCLISFELPSEELGEGELYSAGGTYGFVNSNSSSCLCVCDRGYNFHGTTHCPHDV